MKKTLAALAFALIAGSASAADLVEAIVVRVGDRIITTTQYERRLRDTFMEIDETVPPAERETRKADVRKNLVNELVSELLIKDRADRMGITVSEAEMKDAISRLKNQYGITTDKQFEESLGKSGLTRVEMEARLRDTLVTNKVFGRELRSRQEMPDRELREKYDREKERYRLPERAHLREIIVLRPDSPVMGDLAKRRADELALQAKTAGADFAKIASTSSESATKEKGGELGEVTRGELLAELDKAVFNAPAGSILGPIETRSAWHILKVEQRLPSEVPAFESLKERLRKDATEDTYQRDYKSYIERLRKDAFIQINEQNLPKT